MSEAERFIVCKPQLHKDRYNRFYIAVIRVPARYKFSRLKFKTASQAERYARHWICRIVRAHDYFLKEGKL